MPPRGPKLSALMGNRLQNRMFNNSAHIGHNKFAVLLDRNGKPIVVWSGSTNWTKTGLCAQSNNTIIVEIRCRREGLFRLLDAAACR